MNSANEIRELARTTSNFFVWEASDMIHHSDPIMPAPFYIEEGSSREALLFINANGYVE